MDNLSHSLLGLAVGALADRALAAETDAKAQGTRRRMLLVTGWLAANLPDLDLFLTGLLPAPLGYLLHHRGHTHTIVFALAQAVALMLLVALLWPAARRLLRHSTAARTGLAAAALVGLATHLLLDYLNSYGIHPFYPWSGRWLFGDMIFILEPVFWFALGVPLAWMAPWRWLRAVLLVMFPAFLYWAGTHDYLHWTSMAALLLGAFALSLLRHRPGPSLLAGIGLACVFVLGQAAASHRARAMLADHVRLAAPQALLVDAALTAYPSNPACWNYVIVESAGDSYRLRRGMLSIMPDRVATASCPAGFGSGGTGNTGVVERSVETLARGDLRTLAADCHGAAWLRFARVPRVVDGVANDVRFSRGGSNFSTMTIAQFAGQPCPTGVPPWDMPRSDLLQRRP